MFHKIKAIAIVIVFLNLVFPNLVFAGSVNFDFRFDSDSSSYNNAAKVAGAKESSQFLMRTGRIDFKGNLKDNITYRLRWGVDHEVETATDKIDNVSTHVDYAYVQHQMTEKFALTLGKFASEIGSIEGNLSSPDIYMPSQAYKTISSNNFLYVSGAKVTYSQMAHEVSAYLINQSQSETTEQTKMAYGLVYKGTFLDKTILPNIGHLSDEKQGTTSNVKMTTTITSAGVKWDPKPYYVSFDYTVYAEKNISAVDVNDTMTTMLLDSGYDFEGVIPKFKYEKTTKKSGSSKEQYDGVVFGLEFKPYPDDIFRYHVMVTQMTVKPETGDSRFEQRFLLGTRIYGDFLK